MKIFIGRVSSTKMPKTATVVVGRVETHPVYKKRFRKSRKYHVHDELGVKVGDLVRFTASKPYSHLKKWKIIEVVDKKQKKEDKTKGMQKKGKKS